jgi:predicted enzyme related to lactoylglutathione lyase
VPARPAVPDGAPIWLDLTTADTTANDRAVAFYTALLGWQHASYGPDFGDYGAFTKDGAPVAGVGPRTAPEQRPAWSVYLRSSDVDATATAVTAHGGTVIAGPDDVPGQGRFLTVVDPSGAEVGFWQPAGHDGYAVYGEHGAPSWFELWTNRYEDALEFYRAAAGWPVSTLSDTPDFRYSTYGEGDAAMAGIFDATAVLADGGTPSWAVYLGADDVDATAARAVELGGKAGQAEDTEYGRQVGVQDPNGAWFQLIGVGD